MADVKVSYSCQLDNCKKSGKSHWLGKDCTRSSEDSLSKVKAELPQAEKLQELASVTVDVHCSTGSYLAAGEQWPLSGISSWFSLILRHFPDLLSFSLPLIPFFSLSLEFRDFHPVRSLYFPLLPHHPISISLFLFLPPSRRSTEVVCRAQVYSTGQLRSPQCAIVFTLSSYIAPHYGPSPCAPSPHPVAIIKLSRRLLDN